MSFSTPLGKIDILADGVPFPYTITALPPFDINNPVDARYRIDVDFVPNGKPHLISCCLYPSQKVSGYIETGERLESYGYYSEDKKIKLSIGLEADTGYIRDNNGKMIRVGDEYDYDGQFDKIDGVFYNSYALLPFTKTTHYVFGVAWIFDATTPEKDVLTWYAADPYLMSTE